jgi:hypothetical protein
MKILSENSPFKLLPIQMDGYQLLIFDAIRITFEMIESDYNVLEEKLHHLSQQNTIKENTSQVFGHAWAIVDHTSRLIKLFQKLPSQSNHEILDKILPVNAFRNTIQHLHERIDESMIENRSPFYGILVWYHKNLLTEALTPKTLVSGIAYGFKINFKIPDITKSNQEINSITIQTVDKKKIIELNLSELLQDLHSICIANEEKIGDFFRSQGWELCDWSKRQDIMISLKNED